MMDTNLDSSVEACQPANDLGMHDLITEVVQDIHSVFSPSGNPGFLASEKVTSMLPEGACGSYNTCLKFCEAACLRTISVVTGDSAMAQDVVMIVSDTISGKEITIERAIRRNDIRFDARFTVALPNGNFEAKFVKNSTQELVWPGYAHEVFEAPPKCSDHIMPGDFTFAAPTASRDACNELIYNGNFDSGIEGWTEEFAGITWLATGGLNGSGALGTTKRSNVNGLSESTRCTT
jgi:hypothetical protein